MEAPVRFECSSPILRVEDMQRAVAFYVEKLGFRNEPWGNDDFTSVTRDSAGIYLCRGGAWAWIGVEDAAKLHDEYVARGVKTPEELNANERPIVSRIGGTQAPRDCKPTIRNPSPATAAR